MLQIEYLYRIYLKKEPLQDLRGMGELEVVEEGEVPREEEQAVQWGEEVEEAIQRVEVEEVVD